MKLYSMALTHHFVGPDPADGVEDGVVEAGLFLCLAQALLVGLYVDEFQRVSGAQTAVNDLIAGLEQHVEPLAGAHSEVMLALGTDVEVGFEVGFEDGLPAAGTLDPEPLGADTLFLVAIGFGVGAARRG